MTNFSSFWGWQVIRRGRWLGGLLLLLLLLGQGNPAQASHIRAGDIQSEVDPKNPRHIFFRLTLYTDRFSRSGPNLVLQDTANIFFSDGTCEYPRGINRNTRLNGPREPPIHLTSDTDINYYYFEHTFPSSGTFTVSFIGENRNADVRNIIQSDLRNFYISSRVTIDPALGQNHSPVLKAPAVDKGAVLQVFLHNPGASDADGDSLSYELRHSLESRLGLNVKNCLPDTQTVLGFRYPNALNSSPNGIQVVYTGTPAGIPKEKAIFDINNRTGQITWNAPGDAGIYNVAFVVKEWRRTAFGARLIGEVVRDMQIIVKATTNLRPTIQIPADTCVWAGERVFKNNITATDGSAPGGQPGTPLVMTAFSGILPPATFRQTLAGPPLARGEFDWTPDCANIASEPYQVLFRVQDTPPQSNPPLPSDPPPLIDEKVWRVTVVGPPPRNLAAVPGPTTSGNTTQLTWDSYVCQSSPGTPVEQQARLLIYRKEGTSSFNPGHCDTGIPDGLGYKQVGSVTASERSFLDDNGGKGLERGKNYCYRVYVVFPLPSGGASIASNEACIVFDGRSAMLTNVDVERTSSADGQIKVIWTKPVPPKSQGAFKPPYSYQLSRAEGLTPTDASYVVVAREITNLADTVFVDQRLNTLDKQYTYKLEFRTQSPNGLTNTETSPTASSVRTTAVGQGLTKTIVVNWTFQVPWDNTAGPTRVFRQNKATGAFTEVGTATSTATGGTYTDKDPMLELNQTYCYYVQTEGRYQDFKFLQSLLNKSQQFCVPLSSEPCAPVLTVRPLDCDSIARITGPGYPQAGQLYENHLRWTLGDMPTGCTNENTKYFRIFVRRTEEGPLVLRDSTKGLEFGYIDRNLPSNAACYAVQAVDVNGRRSPLSNIVCIDNCLVFVLPNIFTPNGDTHNDTFRPKVSSPVRRVRFQAFNRWGVKVYEGDKDPLINWDGGGSHTESTNTSRLSDGIFYYLAEVEFADFKNTKRTYKGWVEIRH